MSDENQLEKWIGFFCTFFSGIFFLIGAYIFFNSNLNSNQVILLIMEEIACCFFGVVLFFLGAKLLFFNK